MRKLLWLGAVAVLAGLTLISIDRPTQAQMQPQQPPQASAQRDPLGLTDSQKAQISALNTTSRAHQTAIQSDTKLSAAQKTQQLQNLAKSYRQQSLAILTPSQRAIVTSLNNNNAQIQKLSMKLQASLTVQQKSDLKSLQTSQQSQFQAIVGSKTLTRDQQRIQLTALGKGAQAGINRILNPDQLKLISEMNSLQLTMRRIEQQGIAH